MLRESFYISSGCFFIFLDINNSLMQLGSYIREILFTVVFDSHGFDQTVTHALSATQNNNTFDRLINLLHNVELAL